jgi:hypothetical protein
MAIVDGSLQLGYKDNAWFTANASVVLKVGQIVYLEQTGTYKLGDGVTALSALSFLGGGSGTTPTFQEVTDEGNTTTNAISAPQYGTSGGEITITSTMIEALDSTNTSQLFNVDRSNDIANYKGVEIATVNDIPTVDTTIIDGSTNPVDGNAVFDALALKAPLNILSNIFGSCTVVGWSAYTASIVDVIDLGNVYMININISGTSNSATTTVQLPYTNNGNALLADMTLATNNGTNITGRWVIASGSDTITFNTTAGAGAYSNSGTKTVYAMLMLPK